MEWKEEWEQELQKTRNTKVKGTLFCAYNAFLDYLKKVNESKVEEIFLKQSKENREKILKEINEEKTSIRNPIEFISALLYSIKEGKSSHISCREKKVFEWIEKQFKKPDDVQIGGQAGIIAQQTQAIGGKTILLTIFPSKQLIQFIPDVLVPVKENGLKLIPLQKAFAKEEKESKVNWIFEYRKKIRIKLGKKTIVAPRANRFILASETSKAPVFPKELEKHASLIARKASKAILSGYHYLQLEYDGKSFKRLLQREEEILKKMKKANKKLKIHFEFVPVEHKEIEAAVVKLVTREVHSMGINEVEIVELLQKLGFNKEAKTIKERECAYTLFKGGEKLFEALKLQRLHIHNLGYNVVLLSKEYGVSPKKAVNALLYSSLVANSRAVFGKTVALRQIKENRIPLSEIGFSQLKKFAREARKELKRFNEKQFLRSGFYDKNKFFVIVTPAQVVLYPKIVVGLGDIVSSIAFIA